MRSKILLSVLGMFFWGSQVLAHGHVAIGGGSVAEDDSGMTEIHLPVHVGFDGKVEFGFSDQHDSHMDAGHDGMGDDSMDHHQCPEAEKAGWEFHFSPMLALGGDHVTRLVNIAKANGQLEASADGPYLFIENSRIEGGLGLMIEGSYTNNLAPEIGLGLLPFKGHAMYTERVVQTPADVTKLPPVEIPWSEHRLDKWADGDKLVYTSLGGMMYHLSLGVEGVPLFDFGVSYAASGVWKVTFQKLGDDRLLFSVRSLELRHLAEEVGGPFMSAGLSKFNSADESFNFEINVENEMAAGAMTEAFQGDLRTLQALAAEGGHGVILVSDAKGSSHGSQWGYDVGIPFLFDLSGSKTKMYSYSDTKDYPNDTNERMWMSVASHEHRTSGVWSNHVLKADSFLGGYDSMVHHKTNLEHSVMLGAHVLLYETDEFSVGGFEKFKRLIVDRTGLENTKSLKFPLQEKGYGRVEVQTVFNAESTQTLMKAAAQGQFVKTLEADVEAQIRNYFKTNTREALLLCFNKLRYEECQTQILDRGHSLLEKAEGNLRNMNESLTKGEYDSFTKSYAKFGSLVTGDRFLYRSVLRSTQGAQVVLKLQGEYVRPFSAVLFSN